MFKNYIILAWRVLGRKKFFTFISLFGISFTLGILMVVVSFLQSELGNDKPWTNRNRLVDFSRLEMRNMIADTTYLIDSMMVDGAMKYDTTESYGENSNSTTISSLGAKFLIDHFSDLKHAENYSFMNKGVTYNAYVNNSKIVINVIYTDHRYWEILDYEFIEGRPYDKGMWERAEPVVVITEELADEYFGATRNIIDREIVMDGKQHKVIGLVEKPTSAANNSDAFAPTTLSNNYPGRADRYTGGYNALFLAKSPAGRKALKKEIGDKENTIPLDNITEFNRLYLAEYPGTMFENFAQDLIPFNQPSKSGNALRIILTGIIGLFVLLPTLNLINLNVSRIMERSSEIGVRKSFGASKGNILGQFIFENVILTLIGGLIGLLLAIGLIYFLNTAGVLDPITLTINLKFFIISFIIVIIFGIISGFLPAYRMSKIHIVNALKNNKI